MSEAGYSGTPLARKLGIKPGLTVCLIDAPPAYQSWLAPLPERVTFLLAAPSGSADLVHLFVVSQAAFDRQLPQARQAMKIDGALWVSWYKKSARIPTDIGEAEIRHGGLQTDLVDVKVCAVTEIWSGLKFVVRRTLRQPRT